MLYFVSKLVIDLAFKYISSSLHNNKLEAFQFQKNKTVASVNELFHLQWPYTCKRLSRRQVAF